MSQKRNVEYYACASRGRDPENPSDRSSGNPNLEQRLEINWNGWANTITSVAKDCWVLEVNDKRSICIDSEEN